MKKDMVLRRDSVQNCHHLKECRKPGNRYFMSKNWKRRLVTSFERVKMEKLIVMIKLCYSNQDLNLVTYIWLKKSQITNITYWCKMISILVATLSGSSSRWRTQGKIWQFNSMLWTSPSLTLFSIMVWK